MNNIQGVKSYNVEQSLNRRILIDCITKHLEFYGYKYIEVPTLINKTLIEKSLEGTENKAFIIDNFCLMPEVTNYINDLGKLAIGADKIYYVAKCFRNESTTDSERLREFTQIGVEYLGDNSLDCKKVVRKDAILLMNKLFGSTGWELKDGVPRGLNLYDSDKTFEVHSSNRKQLLGGGPYKGGAGWALGLERLMIALNN